MKWVCKVIFLFIFCTHITMWAMPRSHFHDNEELACGTGLPCNGHGFKELFTRNEANRRTKRGNRRILDNSSGSGENGSAFFSEESDKSDYAVSDPAPVAQKPTKKPIQYRIFSRPPASSPTP